MTTLAGILRLIVIDEFSVGRMRFVDERVDPHPQSA
jgi:hypothetical protein